MSTVRYTGLARKDLLAIWVTAASHDPRTSDRVFDRIEESCQRLGDYPQLGRSVQTSRPIRGRLG